MKTNLSIKQRQLLLGLGLLLGAGLAQAQPEAANNPYGVATLWAQADLVQRTVLAILLTMSVGSWFILISKFFEQARVGRQNREAGEKFWQATTVREGAEVLAKNSPFRYLAEAGLASTAKHAALEKHIGLHEWVTLSIERAIEKVQGTQQRGLAFLAAVSA